MKMKKNLLPIDAFRDQILESIKENPVTVIVAETGAGKSTQVPQYLLAEGYDLVVTQPRRLAARSVATRVAQEMGEKIGATIGYRTAVERVDSPETRCLFCTDGLALVRELMGQNKGILVLDEVHEWNENMEVLVAWVKSQIAAGAAMKTVLMSATLEAEKLSAFFNNAPIISVPGRTFPVEDRTAGKDIETDVATLVAEGRNVLVFQPGQQEINETINRLTALKVSAVILPLHGQLTPEEQSKCFKHYDRPKVIVSTNVAQTSVTIDDIDAVVDSGLERRIELVDGVEGLYLKPISLADAKQRKGRAGRVKAGIYIDHCPTANRPAFPVAEILRKRLDQTVLRLAIAGFDMEVMEFFHQPAKSDIHDAHETLIGLGCMTHEGKVTGIGRLVNKLPVSVKYGRMLVEADRLGVVDDILTVAAIMEMDGITVPPPSNNRPDRPDWRGLVPNEKESDIMAQLKVWQLARTMSEVQMKDSGISLRKLYRAKEIRQTLSEALRGHFRFGTNGKRENILKAVCAGMVDHLFKGGFGRYDDEYQNGDETLRKLGSSSVVERSMPDWVVGVPFDLQIATKRGSMTLNLISMATKVDPSWLAEVAPHMVTEKIENLHWDREQNCVVEDHVTIFNGQEIARVAKSALFSVEAFKIFVSAMMSTYTSSEVVNALYRSNTEVLSQYNAYFVRSGGTIPQKDSEIIRELYVCVLEPKQVLGFVQFESLGLNSEELQIKLSNLISQEEITAIEAGNPNEIEVGGEKFSVTYKNDYGSFYARIEVTENFIREAKVETVTLPNGRELKLCHNGYTRTLREHREVIEKARLEEIERAQRNLVYNFENQISEALQIPSEMPFYQWGTTELGSRLRTRLETLKAEMVECLTQENSAERVEAVRTKAEEIKTELRTQHENAQALIAKTEEGFEKTLAEAQQEFVRAEADEIRNHIYQAKNALQRAEFAGVDNHCREVEKMVANLQSLAEMRKQERDELIKNNNVPDYLLDAFRGDLDRTLEFMQNVAKVETWRLDAHELTCGRSRSRATCENAWSAMDEETDFFCGADPNDVKGYVYDFHFGEDATPVGRKEEKGSFNSNLSASNDTMAEALRRAGLIK